MKSTSLAARCQHRDYSPVSWTHYFDEALDVSPPDNLEQSSMPTSPLDLDYTNSNSPPKASTFRVYTCNFKPPYAPIRPQDARQSGMTETEFNSYNRYPTIVALHGGGYSGLTWAQFTHHINNECHCRVIAIDLRGHGDTKTDDDEKMDIETLVDDVIQVTHETHRLYGFLQTPKTILIGHSMGGAIAIKCAAKCADLLPSLTGFIIIDVVEGTAKDALPLMMSVIKTRPTRFLSLDNAIEWSVRSGMAKNLDAARVSMPGNLLNIASGQLAIHDIKLEDDETQQRDKIIKNKFHISIEKLLAQKNHPTRSLPRGLPISPRVASLRASGSPVISPAATPNSDALDELDELVEDEVCDTTTAAANQAQDDLDGYKRPPGLDVAGYCWRTDLAKTQPHWPGWFEGLSEQMLSAPVQGKFLLLAGIDRLDKTLTIGQMQGKFMMKVLPKCGHAVHEDSPERVAAEIGQFLVRNKLTTSIDAGD